jgi:hypothetical protein
LRWIFSALASALARDATKDSAAQTDAFVAPPVFTPHSDENGDGESARVPTANPARAAALADRQRADDGDRRTTVSRACLAGSCSTSTPRATNCHHGRTRPAVIRRELVLRTEPACLQQSPQPTNPGLRSHHRSRPVRGTTDPVGGPGALARESLGWSWPQQLQSSGDLADPQSPTGRASEKIQLPSALPQPEQNTKIAAGQGRELGKPRRSRPVTPHPPGQSSPAAKAPEAARQRSDLGGRNWVRTSDPSLVRIVTTTPPPAGCSSGPGHKQQDEAQRSV